MRLPRAGTVEIVPSVLSADFARLADEIAVITSADCIGDRVYGWPGGRYGGCRCVGWP